MSRPRFNPRGNFPLQRPRAPNPSGMRPPGPFMRPGSMGLPRFYPAGRARGIPHRFAGHESYQNMGPQRMNVQVTQHRTDPRLTKEKLDFHEAQQKKGKPHGSRWDDEPHISASVGVKQSSVTQVTDQSPKVQSRYTKESASSILASFGLSNEDLEELSRYPDEQLTPENMPLILRDIRMRKMGRRLPNLPSQSRNKETLDSEAVSSNVIDYGHASKYGYTEDPLEVRIYDPEIPTDEVKNEFRSQQNISASVPTPNVICNSMFPIEDVFRQMDFPNESSNNQSFFPVESGTKMSGLHISGGQSVLEPVKSASQSISQTVNQTMSQSLIPPSMNQQPFSSELISAVNQQERIPREPVINSSNVHRSGGNKKNYQSEADMPIQSPFGIVKASWLPKFSHADAQKMKRLPTPSMMNDYYAASPRIFPHLCSLCNVECSHLKDWIQHQNTSTHIESCRQLRQQYPDWNPEILPSRRNEGNRKENETPRRRSHSPSPRRSRRSSSSHRFRRSRSPIRYIYRPRSRSPRICHRFVSRYRSRSRSPYRVRNPFRGSPKYYRSVSPERTSRRSVRSSDRKKALEDVVQRSGLASEFNKQKHLEAVDKGHSPAQKLKTGSGSKPSVKPTSSTKSDSNLGGHSTRYKSKNPEDDTLPECKQVSDKAVSLQRKLRKDQSSHYDSVLLISELPEDGCTEEDIRKIFQPFGKVNDVLIVPYRKEVKVEIPLVASTPTSIELFTENLEESVLNQQMYTSDFEKEEAEIINPETELSTSDSTFIEERNIKGILEESPSETEDFFSGITESLIEAVAEEDKHESVSEIVPSACIVALVPGISTGDEKAVSKKGISEKSNMDEKEENEFNTKESKMDLQIGTEKAEKNDARMVAEKLEKIVAAMKEKPAENAVTKVYPNKGVSQANKPDETSKTSVLVASNAPSSKSSIKAGIVSSPKAKATASKSENQKSFLKSVLRDQINAEKKLSAKELGLLKPTSARPGLAESSSKFKPTQSGIPRGGSGRISALQGKDSKLDYRDITKQSQEAEARPSFMKRDDSNNKTFAGQNTKNPKSTTGRSSKSKEEPLFPFNLDEFVTVDEVIEEVNPFQAKQAPPKGKRKEALKNTPSSELNLKKKRGKTSAPRVVEGELSFVTLDEIGEEEDAATHLAQALVTVDEVIDEEEINMEEMVKNSNSLLTLDELIDQDDCISHSEPKDVTVLSVAEEQDLLKQERLVTVDEIGEVEELPLNESTDISFATLNTKGDEGNTGRDSIGFISSQMPEDPSTLVTVDEIQDDSSDLHLVTLDEVTEEDEDSLADFNNLKEELNFVTVDEVGEEEDGDNDLKVELAQSKNDHPTDKRGDRKKRAVDTKKTKLEALSQVGLVNETVLEEDLKTMIERHLAAKVPTKRVRIGKTPPSEKAVVTEPVKGEEAFQINEVDEESGLKDSEPERKRKKTEDSSLGKSVAPDVPEDLDFLVPKAGFFCPICSLFYSGEKAMTNHCKSTRHKQNTEKFMAKQRKEKEQNEAEERSSR
uniref:Zinc finger protein 638 n=1 Tax=Equus caballus TaxID=9796 RepID=A0A9L0S7U9_HORSE